MFEQLFTTPRSVERYFRAPLLEERRRHLAHCAAQGSTRSSLRLIAQHQLVSIEYLHLLTAESVTVEQIRAAADSWVGRQPQPHTHNATDYRYGKLRFISDARQWLSFLGRLRTIEPPRRPYTELIEGFTDYMVRERGPVATHHPHSLLAPRAVSRTLLGTTSASKRSDDCRH